MSDTKYAVKSGFYDSVNRDRLYSADDMNEPYKSFLTEGIVEGSLAVSAQSTPDMTLNVAAGKALLGYKWVSAAATTVTVPANTALYSRIDSIILQVNVNTDVRAAAIIYRTGTPAETPEAPALIGTTGITEVRIANITVAAGATAIDSTKISDQRGGSSCPYITIQVGDSQLEATVEDVLEAHPEWTTTVEDGSITVAKLAAGVIDNTLSVAGAAADAKKTGDEIASIKSDLGEITDVLEIFYQQAITIQNGFYNGNGVFTSNSEYRCAEITVTEGEKYKITASWDKMAGMAIALVLNSSNQKIAQYLSTTDQAQTADDYLITIPDNGTKLCINSKRNVGIIVKKGVINPKADRDLSAIQNNIAKFDSYGNPIDCGRSDVDYAETKNIIIWNRLNNLPIEQGFYGQNGNYTANAGFKSLSTSVTAGEVYKITCSMSAISGLCLGVIKDSNNAVLQVIKPTNGQAQSADNLEIVMPDNADSLHISAESSRTIGMKRGVVQPFNKNVIVNFGDSIIGATRGENSVSENIKEKTGATVYNVGFGGCRMSQHDANWDAFSMYRLAYAVAHDDFSIQDAVDISTSGLPSYFAEQRTLLESIDFSQVDIVTIGYGTNDFTAGVSLNNPSDLDDTSTFEGALRYSLEQLLTAFPHLKIFVCGQTYRFWMDESYQFVEDSNTKVIDGNTLIDFVESTEKVSNEYNVPFIDNYYIGIGKYSRTYYFPSTDGTHPNAKGNELIARHMVHELF